MVVPSWDDGNWTEEGGEEIVDDILSCDSVMFTWEFGTNTSLHIGESDRKISSSNWFKNLWENLKLWEWMTNDKSIPYDPPSQHSND